MAKNVYVGVNNVARKVTSMYVGVNGVARKITKGYVGVNGVAQQFFAGANYINFTSNPAPTSWSGGGVAANSESSASNTYGTWKCYATAKAFSSSYMAKNCFDNNTSSNSYFRTESGKVNYYAFLRLPTDIAIKPSTFSWYIAVANTSSEIQGLDENGNWETLAIQTETAPSSATNYTFNVSTTKYYTAFRCYMVPSGSYSAKLFDFSITSGTIKDSR